MTGRLSALPVSFCTPSAPTPNKEQRPVHESHRPIVWIFAKWPDPGAVKTRLCPPLSPEQAAQLARAFLDDRVDTLRRSSSLDFGIATTPASAEPRFQERYPDLPLYSQGEGNLGDRMARVVRDSLDGGHPAAILVGSDVPLLPLTVIEDSARLLLLREADLVLTPSLDGGYSLIGQCRLHPPLFHEMPWSTPEVLSETLRRAETLRLRVRLTEPMPDCDTPDDLRDLSAFTSEHPERFRELAPRTSGLLHEFRPLFPGMGT